MKEQRVRVTWQDGKSIEGTPQEIMDTLAQAWETAVGEAGVEDDESTTYQEELVKRLVNVSGEDHWDAKDPARLLWQMATARLIRLEYSA